MRVVCPLTILLLAGLSPLSDAESPYQQAVGLQLAITAEPFDAQRNRWEINIVPLVFQQRLSPHWQWKWMPLLNMRLDPNTTPALSHAGVAVSGLYHAAGSGAAPAGWNAGPQLAYSFNLADRNHNLTIAGEMGYAIAIKENVILNITGELGATWFDQLTDEHGKTADNSWRSHFGVKPQLSLWY